MKWPWRTEEPDVSALKAKQAECKHDGRFTVYGWNSSRPLSGTCNDCGKEVPFDDILNVYLGKMNAILDKHGVR